VEHVLDLWGVDSRGGDFYRDAAIAERLGFEEQKPRPNPTHNSDENRFEIRSGLRPMPPPKTAERRPDKQSEPLFRQTPVAFPKSKMLFAK